MANSKKKQTLPNRMDIIEQKFESIQKAVDIMRKEQAEYYQNFNDSMGKLTNEINFIKETMHKSGEVTLKNGKRTNN